MIKKIKDNFLLFLIICAIIFLVLDSIFKIYIPCVFKSITGLYCPGCGVTRMLKSMLVFDFYQAFRYNPFLFILSPFIFFLLFNYLYFYYRKKESIFKKIPNKIWNILLVITIIYWILRNIIPWLAPTVV